MEDYILFFNKAPEAFPLFETVYNFISNEFDDIKIKAQKTQITFSNRYGFAFISLPKRKIKSPADVSITLTLGLNRKVESPRVYYASEPYPGRWTHHIIVKDESEIDSEIKEWIREAYYFAMMK
jgi:hypothetical protein